MIEPRRENSGGRKWGDCFVSWGDRAGSGDLFTLGTVVANCGDLRSVGVRGRETLAQLGDRRTRQVVQDIQETAGTHLIEMPVKLGLERQGVQGA
jgi:hypothetical protein